MVDWMIELSGGLLGSYFGVMVAALFTAMNREVTPQHMQSSIKSGLGLGFVFWALGISFLNRVLIQGISRASIGKKLFKLELISEGGPLTWSKVTARWVLSVGSFAALGAGYLYSLFNSERRTLHDVLMDTDVVRSFESNAVTIEVKSQEARTEDLREWMVISNAHAERPTATVIKLPVPEKEEKKKAS